MARITDSGLKFVRSIFSRDKQKSELAVTSRELIATARGGAFGAPIDVSGVGGVGEALGLDRRMLYRYFDYEEMDEYGDISCLAGDSMVFTLDRGWLPIATLAAEKKSFSVLSYDIERRSLVPALCDGARKTGSKGHRKGMVRVVLDNGSSIRCTRDHLFMAKDGRWVAAGELSVGERLMPGVLRLRQFGGDSVNSYWQVHQPHSDSQIKDRESRAHGERWLWLHRLVAQESVGREKGDIVHHINGNPLNNDPSNLSVEDHATHAQYHIAQIDNSRYFPEWTNERRREMSERMKGNTHSKGNVLSAETRQKMSAARKGHKKSEEWRRKIGDANRINLSREEVEAALDQSESIADAARLMGVSWSTMKRNVVRHDLQNSFANHRVLRVEVLDETEDVYDLSVPIYHNFVCNGVVVHNSALDIYADDATQTDSQTSHTVWVESQDKRVKEELEDMFWKRLDIEEKIWPITRTLCKYGNDYEEIVVSDKGVVDLRFMPPATVRRIETPKGDLIGFTQSYTQDVSISEKEFEKMKLSTGAAIGPGKDIAAFEDWRVSHMRLLSKHRDSLYGWAITEPARWVWKRLMLLEDAVLVYKLTRSPSRYAFYIDVGKQPKQEAERSIREVMQRLKKKKFVNPKTGKLDLKFNPLAMDEDFFLGVRDGKESTRVETLMGPSYQQVEDVQYFLYKLYAALKVPRAYLGYDENMPSKATLSQEDVRFARTVLRVQREVRNGLKKMSRVDLACRNIDPAAVDFDVKMTVPSAIFELGQMEVRRARADLASLMERHVSLNWLLSNVYGLSDDEIADIAKQKKDEQKLAGAQMGGGFESRMSRKERDLISERLARSTGGISERELFQGNREDEKRAEEIIRKVLADPGNPIGERLKETGALLREILHTVNKAA